MNRSKNTLLALCAAALLTLASCQNKGNMWEDNQTVGAKYSSMNATALWGDTANETPASNFSEDFIPLNEKDLQIDARENMVAQAAEDLGEGEIPSAERFVNPTGAAATLLSPIFFDTDNYTVTDKKNSEKLKKIANYLISNPRLQVVVEGHCDERGLEAYNLALGTRRANAVRSQLVKFGVNPNQIHTVSIGKERPFAFGHNQKAWAENRRAHFKVFTMSKP